MGAPALWREQQPSPQYAIDAPVEYQGDDDLKGSGVIANISASGALIETVFASAAPGTRLRLRISYFVGSFGVELPAEVVRTTEFGFAVRFGELAPESLELLDRIVSHAESRLLPCRQDSAAESSTRAP